MSAVNPDHWAGCDCSQCMYDLAVAPNKTGSSAERDAPTIGDIMTRPASPAQEATPPRCESCGYPLVTALDGDQYCQVAKCDAAGKVVGRAAPTPEATAPREYLTFDEWLTRLRQSFAAAPAREASSAPPEATGAAEPDCLTAGDGSCIDARPCIHTPRDDAQDRADELDGYASLTVEDRDWIEHLITTDGDWIPGVPERFLRRYEATLVRLEATVAALTAERAEMAEVLSLLAYRVREGKTDPVADACSLHAIAARLRAGAREP